MPKEQTLQVKNGREYWRMLEQTARLVDAWPDWKKGEPSATERVLLSDAGAGPSSSAGAPERTIRE